MKNLIETIWIICIALIFSGCSQNVEWFQYLGPERNATVSGDPILNSWGENGPGEEWSFPLGVGYSGVCIYDNEVFILDREKGKSDILRCIDFDTGKEKWNFEYEAPGELPYPGSRATPVVNNKYIWSVGPHGNFYCINKKNQKAVWSHNLKEEFDVSTSKWGFSQSPLLYNDLIIIYPHAKEAGVVAYRQADGSIAWESRPLTGSSFHVSPTLASFGGVDQVIMTSPYDRKDSTKIQEVVSFDANTGEELWKYNGLKSFAIITPPSVISENKLLLTDCSYNGSYSPVTILLEIEKVGEEFKIKEVFKTEEAGCKMHPGVLYEGHIYLNSTGRPNKISCLDMNGNDLWAKDSVPGSEMGAMILINDLIVSQDGKSGDIKLIEPSPDGYNEIGRASFFEAKKNQSWAPIAFYKGHIIIRNLEKMVCVNLTELAE